MEGIFTLPYSEYEVISCIQKKLSKSEGYCCYIPTSRQQKGIDFIIHNSNSNKILRIQVKSSRCYQDKHFLNNFWFNNFLTKYKKGNADYYMLFGLYPEYTQKDNIKSKVEFWKEVILCFSEEDMIKILKKVRTKKEKNPDRFFGFGFDTPKEVFSGRGFLKQENFSQYLLENSFDDLKNKLK